MGGWQEKPLFQLKVSTFAVIVLALPTFGFFFCVIWSILYDFESSTATHCRVKNYLPSISSAIGGYTPQRYVWRICIALHCAPRFMLAFAYYNYHTQIDIGHWLYSKLAALCTFLHIIENLALVGLTYISSIESHDTHENLFILFMVASQLYMLLTCIVYKWGLSHLKAVSSLERKSIKYKVGLFIFNVTSFLVAVYLFFRHNWYCETGMYTWFAFGEYLTVLSNIAFHGTGYFDFGPQSWITMGHPDYTQTRLRSKAT